MEIIIRQLRNMENQVKKLKKQDQPKQGKLTIVIEADPSHPPRSLQALILLILKHQIPANVTVHQHSSLNSNCSKDDLAWAGPSANEHNRVSSLLNLTWIWKPVGRHPNVKFVNHSCADLTGEMTIARLLTRLLESWTDSELYESLGFATTVHVDEWLDLLENSNQSNASGLIKLVEARLSTSEWLAGPAPGVKSLADIVYSNVLRDRLQSVRGREWVSRCCPV